MGAPLDRARPGSPVSFSPKVNSRSGVGSNLSADLPAGESDRLIAPSRPSFPSSRTGPLLLIAEFKLEPHPERCHTSATF